MPLYECVLIARQDISASQVEGLTDHFKSIIEQRGGAVRKQEYWGLRSLAFRIKKNRKGHYVLFGLDSPSDAVHEMERNMRLNEDVLRFLTVRVDAIDEEPSIIVRSRHSRDDGPRGRGPRGRDGPGRDGPGRDGPGRDGPGRDGPARDSDERRGGEARGRDDDKAKGAGQ
jgi:small subunit ribosomal protein S6